MTYLEKNFRRELLETFRRTPHLAIPLETGSTYRGIPDVMVFIGNQPAMFLELKSTGHKEARNLDSMVKLMSPEQKRFAEKMTKRKQKSLLVVANSPQRGIRTFNICVPYLAESGIIYRLQTVSGARKESLNLLVDKLTKIDYTV